MVNYPTDKANFIKELLASKTPKELLVAKNLDSDYLAEIAVTIEERLIPISMDDRRRIITSDDSNAYKEANKRYKARINQGEVISIIKEYLHLSNTLIKELKKRFNPDFATIILFKKVFFYRSLSEFSRFGINIEGYIKAIKDQGDYFEGDIREFYLEKLLKDILHTNQKVEYAEQLIKFKRAFSQEFGSLENKTKQSIPLKNISQDNDFTQKEIALFYVYLIESDTIPMPSPKKEGLMNWATAWDKSPIKFYRVFNKIHNNKERLRTENIESINKILVILQYFPNAIKLAKKEILDIKKEILDIKNK